MNNFEEMDNFFEKNNLPKLNQKEIKNPNRPTTSREIETVIKIFQQTKAQDGFTGEFYQKFREEIAPILLKIFQRIVEEGKLLNLFYEATISLIPNQTKMPQKKKTTGQYH